MSKKQKKTINVYNVHGVLISKCTKQRAMSVVSKGNGYYLTSSKTDIKLYNDKVNMTKVKQKLIHDQKRICYICCRKIPCYETATVDHIMPRSRYQNIENEKFNMKCCCESCNTDKKDMTLSEYIIHVKLNRKDYTHISDKHIKFLEDYVIMFMKELDSFCLRHNNKI